MTYTTHKASFDSWEEAVGLVHRWLEHAERLDDLMEKVSVQAIGVERARVQHLVYGVVRHHLRLQNRLSARVSRAPRHKVQAILYVAGFELIEAMSGDIEPGLVAKVVHHAVEHAKQMVSPPEVKLLNAVLRRLGSDLAEEKAPVGLANSAKLADYFSHPDWLVSRWLAQFGAANTRALLEWNQQPALIYARWRGRGVEAPAWMQPTKWSEFYLPQSGHWKEIEALILSGHVYVQDPSTRLAVDLLAPKMGETVLDLCAAPGGKSVMVADRMGEGQLVAVDLPGQRQERLKQNLGRICGVESVVVQADIAQALSGELQQHHLPQQYPAVLLDAPCSNSGVMRHRVDVKERLQISDFAKHARQQLGLLKAAARYVAPGGRLVYSTCSLDPEENDGVIETFLATEIGKNYALDQRIVANPWDTGHDGAGVFRLRRK